MIETDGHWILGYGSLIWRPDFPYQRRVPARVRGWSRRFWQWSTDHRGVPELPGRVVTLVPSDDSFGAVAFQVAPETLEQILRRLDYREKGGYARFSLAAESDEAGQLSALTYVATPENPNYAGPAPLEEIAERVRIATGPSGSNRDYVLKLAEALDELGLPDDHVRQLATLVR